MIVTKIEPAGKNRSKVYLDEQLAFVLYKGELSSYGIEEGRELSGQTYREIMETVLEKRAKLRCMNLLKTMDRTEFQLRQKLGQGDYPEEIIDKALDYVKSFGYVDDMSYARRYLEGRQDTRSRAEISRDLMKKGIPGEIIRTVLEETEAVDQTELIKKWIVKKHVDLQKASSEEKQRLYMFLLRKGFSSGEIMRVFRETSFDSEQLPIF